MDHTTTALDEIVETLCELLEVDYAGVHIVEADRQITLAGTGDGPHPPVPRSDSICATLLPRHGQDPLIEVPDAATDPLLRASTFVDPGGTPIRFYAATPLSGPDGTAVGTLCVVSQHPRQLTDLERRTLVYLGHAATRFVPATPVG